MSAVSRGQKHSRQQIGGDVLSCMFGSVRDVIKAICVVDIYSVLQEMFSRSR